MPDPELSGFCTLPHLIYTIIEGYCCCYFFIIYIIYIIFLSMFKDEEKQ